MIQWNIRKLFTKRKKKNIMFIGLDKSGKSSIIKGLQVDKLPFSQPPRVTVGFSVQYLKVDKFQFTIFDMSGQERYRELWQNYYHETDAVVFVVDCSDCKRFAVVRDELRKFIAHKNIKNKEFPFLILVNKIDLYKADNIDQILGLNHILNKPFALRFCSVRNGDGLKDAFNWLCVELEKNTTYTISN